MRAASEIPLEASHSIVIGEWSNENHDVVTSYVLERRNRSVKVNLRVESRPFSDLPTDSPIMITILHIKYMIPFLPALANYFGGDRVLSLGRKSSRINV